MIFSKLSAAILSLQIGVASAQDFLDKSKTEPMNKLGKITEKDQWKSISPNVEFQSTKMGTSPAMNKATNGAISRMLSDSDSSNPYYDGLQSTSVEYDTYQLSWRLLGFYIDCNYDGDNQQSQHSNSGDVGCANDDDGGETKVCNRQVLYGVYVDPYYEGGGIGEYTYYDRFTDTWVCGPLTKYYYDDYYGGDDGGDDGGRRHLSGSGDNEAEACRAQMDCHLEDTNWELLGVFKVDNVSDGDGWMEQLFKHEGVCVWTDDEYSLADGMREDIPSQCVSTGSYDSDGNQLFYHLKPVKNANITLGLYTDCICSEEYDGDDELDVFYLAGIDETYMDAFNSALNIYKQCQPCIAHDLYDEDFECYDEAGYTNCDQCMKFVTKAEGLPASENDIMTASRQQTLLGFEINGKSYGSGGYGRSETDTSYVEKMMAQTIKAEGIQRWETDPNYYALFVGSWGFFVLSLAFFVKMRLTPKDSKKMKKPLISTQTEGEVEPQAVLGPFT